VINQPQRDRFRRLARPLPREKNYFWWTFWEFVIAILAIGVVDIACDLVEEVVKPEQQCLRCEYAARDRVVQGCNGEQSFILQRPNRICPTCHEEFVTARPYYLKPIRSIVREQFGTLLLR
jgi:Zn finger protein HypA/HybF involved in hydrogenase expression